MYVCYLLLLLFILSLVIVVVVIVVLVVYKSMCVGYSFPHKYATREVTLCYLGPGITCGLSDIYALRGKPVELTVKMNTDCEGTWFKDGEAVRRMNYCIFIYISFYTFLRMAIFGSFYFA